MNDQTRNTIIIIVAIALAIYLVASPQDLTRAFASLQQIVALVFYGLGAAWFWKHRK